MGFDFMQIVKTITGKTYSLTFSVGDAADGCIGYMMVDAYVDRRTLQVPYESNGTGGFKKAALKFVATGNRTHVIFLSSNYHMKFDGSLCGPVVDDVLLLSVRNPRRRLLWALNRKMKCDICVPDSTYNRCSVAGMVSFLRKCRQRCFWKFYSNIRKH